MKKVIISFLIICNIFLSGCFNYQDVNKLLFPTAVIVDVDNSNNPVIYLETFKPVRSSEKGSEKGERLIFKGTGKTVFETLRDIHLSSSYEFNYSQNKVVVFTEKAAKAGIDSFIDHFDRGQEFVVRSEIAITQNSPEELLDAKVKSEEYLGIYISELIENEGAASRAVRLTMNEYLIRRLIGSRTTVIPVIKLKKDNPSPALEMRGGAIVVNDKMVDFMDRREGLGYNFLMNNLDAGSLEITNPEHEDVFISFRILRSKTKTELSYDGKVIYLRKKINLKVDITEIQKGLTLDNIELEKIKQTSISNINNACNKIFNNYKNKGIDIFEIKEEFERKYPKAKVEDPLKITQLDLEVGEFIEGAPDTQDFR